MMLQSENSSQEKIGAEVFRILFCHLAQQLDRFRYSLDARIHGSK